MQPLLDGYPLVIAEDVAWGEMDAYLHVNNVVYFRWFESARMAYFARSGLMAALGSTGFGPILAATSCRYRAPLTYPDRIHIGARVTEVGTDRFTMGFAIASDTLGCIAAEGDGVIVCFDYAAGAKATIPGAALKLLRDYDPGAGVTQQ
jgi:acyl-CoA thioester hydrolase